MVVYIVRICDFSTGLHATKSCVCKLVLQTNFNVGIRLGEVRSHTPELISHFLRSVVKTIAVNGYIIGNNRLK